MAQVVKRIIAPWHRYLDMAVLAGHDHNIALKYPRICNPQLVVIAHAVVIIIPAHHHAEHVHYKPARDNAANNFLDPS